MNSFDLGSIEKIYLQFLANFPPVLQPIISILLAALIVYAIIQVIKKDFIYLIVVIILLPASIPILKNILDSVIQLLKFLIPFK